MKTHYQPKLNNFPACGYKVNRKIYYYSEFLSEVDCLICKRSKIFSLVKKCQESVLNHQFNCNVVNCSFCEASKDLQLKLQNTTIHFSIVKSNLKGFSREIQKYLDYGR